MPNADSVAPQQMPTTPSAVATEIPAGKPRTLPPGIPAVLVNSTPLSASAVSSNPLLASVATLAAPVPAALQKLPQGSQLQVRLLQVVLPPTRVGLTPPAVFEPSPAAVSTPSPPPPTAYGNNIQAQAMASARSTQIAQATVGPPAGSPAVAALPNAVTPKETASLSVLMQAGIPIDSMTDVANQAATVAAITAQEKAVRAPLPQGAAATAAMPAAASALPEKVGIPALVIGHEKNGAAILQTPAGTIKMHLPQPLPVGSSARIEVAVVKPQTPTAPLPTVPEEIEPLTTLAQRWPVLDEIAAKYPIHDGLIGQPLMQSLPEIGNKLTSGLLFFLAAVKGGDARQWLGQKALAALEAKAPELAARLKSDMAQLQGMLIDSPLQHWNSVMVPMLYQGQLEHARLFFRHDQESGSESLGPKTSKDHRFIVEVDLSHLGEMQFDGFVRQGDSAKQFDLIVRSNQRLPDALGEQIRATFETAMETTGLKGFLGFQHGNQHFVRPLADREPSASSDGGAQPILA